MPLNNPRRLHVGRLFLVVALGVMVFHLFHPLVPVLARHSIDVEFSEAYLPCLPCLGKLSRALRTPFWTVSPISCAEICARHHGHDAKLRINCIDCTFWSYSLYSSTSPSIPLHRDHTNRYSVPATLVLLRHHFPSSAAHSSTHQ